MSGPATLAATETSSSELWDEIKGWLEANWDPDLTADEWWKVVAAAGWTVPHLPPEQGGRGLSRRSQATVRAGFVAFGALRPPGGLGLLMAAPTILTHGTPEQVARLVPPILEGRAGWCQLFSEPGAGSDLAGLTTRATWDGNRWIISGQKVWSSEALACDHGMLLARTNFDVPKHKGISWFAFDLDQPGVTIRPLREMTGQAVFNEIFLDDAVCEADDLIGGEGNGWAVTQTTLFFERSGIGAGGGHSGFPKPGPKGGMLGRRAGDAAMDVPPSSKLTMGYGDVVQLARQRGAAHDPHVRQDLARLYTFSEVGRWNALAGQGGGGPRGRRRPDQHRQAHPDPHREAGGAARAGRPRRRRPPRRHRRGRRRRPGRGLRVLAGVVDLRRHRRDPAQHRRGALPRPAPRAGPGPGATLRRGAPGPSPARLTGPAELGEDMTDIPFMVAIPARLGVTARFEDGALDLDLRPSSVTLVHGSVRAGVLAFMIDAVAGIVVDHDPDVWAFTTDLSLRMRPVAAPARITAAATIVRQGRRSSTCTVDVTDDAGELLAVGTAGFANVPRRAGDPPKISLSPANAPARFRDFGTIERPLREEAGIEVVDARNGVVQLAVRPELCNPAGTLQGAMVALLAEVGAEELVAARAGGPVLVTELDVRYLDKATEGTVRTRCRALGPGVDAPVQVELVSEATGRTTTLAYARAVAVP